MENNWRNEMDGHITKVFNRFAGQTVNPADPQDKVLAEMRQEAAMYYSYLRLVPPARRVRRMTAKSPASTPNWKAPAMANGASATASSAADNTTQTRTHTLLNIRKRKPDHVRKLFQLQCQP